MLNSQKDYKHIIFDLDGTLSDPSKGIFNGFRHALNKMGVQNVDESVFTLMIGPPLQTSFSKHFFSEKAEIEQAVKYFREYYSVTGLFENAVYDGVPDLLKSLNESGKKLFVATNKPQPFAISILKHFKLDAYFESIHGVDLSNPASCKDELVELILKKVPTSELSNTVIVGDTLYDVQAGKQFGFDTIALTYGFGSRESLVNANPTVLVDSIPALKEILILVD